MYILYLDESGVPEAHPSQTSHYVFLGMAVHESTWFDLDRKVQKLRQRYARAGQLDFELHAAWMRRPYPEQDKIPNFSDLGTEARYEAVQDIRKREILENKISGRHKRERKRVHRNTEPFLHLTYDERLRLLDEALKIVGGYRGRLTLFAEAIRKERLFPGADAIDQAFTQVVTRFEAFLKRRKDEWGILRGFQREGARWRNIDRVIEAPFFFDSETSSGVQVTDLCAYALRRYLENDEEVRFRSIFSKFDRTGSGLHGIRHYTKPGCPCMICRERKHD